jgi:hypothetical protein
MDYLGTGAPELTMGPHAHGEAMPGVERPGVETPVAPEAPPGVKPELQTTPQTLAQRSPTPTLDAVASEARARAQTPEQAALDELRQQAAPSPDAPAGSAVEALKRQATADMPSAPKVETAPAEVSPPPAPSPEPSRASGAPEVAESPDARQRLAEVSAQEAEQSRAAEALPSPKVTPFEPEPREPQRLAQFIRTQGGLNDEGGDIRSTLGGAKYRPGLINKDGLPMDEAALRAWQAGYFPEFGEERPSINDLREALDDDLKYRPRYSMYDDAAVANYENTKFRNSEVDRLASQYGIDTNGKTRDQFFEELNTHLDQPSSATLYSFPGALVDPEAWRRAFGPLAPVLGKLRDSSRALAQTIADGVAPMQSGTKRSQAFAADFANGLRGINYRFGEIDNEIAGAFSRQERDQMGRALDAQSVFEQQLRQMPAELRDAARAEFDSGATGLAGLNERQRQTIDSLDAISQDVWRRMQERGMVAPQAQGLPYYMPRQILMWSEENGFQRPGGGGPSASIGIDNRGANLTTAGPMRREHMTPEETEAAAQAKLGEGAQLLRDIRSLPARLAFSERAIVGTDLMNRIADVGRETGVNLVVRGDIPGLLNPGDYFTMADHPSFRRWTGTGWQALHVAKEFEGPLKAVLSKKSPEWYRAAQNLKSGVMSAIMYSPFIHLAVELGRSLPVMPLRVLTLQALRDGNRLRSDLGYMDQATRDGLAPLGRRGWVDVATIADQAREPPHESALRSAIMAIPHAWEQMHQRLLWDKVFDLQVGIYDTMRSRYIDKGFAPDVAGTMAAHLANRYAGALPPEHLSRGANMMANLLLFSRSFTLGNLGVMKDMFNGAPAQIRSRIEQMAGADVAKSAQSAMRRKAITAFTMDIGLFYAANGLLQAGLQVMRQSQASGLPQAAQDTFNQWYDEATSAVANAGNNPLSIFGVLPQHWNEPGKQDRVYAGTDSTGRGVYLRLPPGKVGEEFLGWFAKPGTMLMNKASPMVRPIIELIMGHDSLGRELLPPNPRTIGDYVDTAGAIVKHIGENLGPTAALQGAKEMFQQYVQGKPTQADPGISAAKVILPTLGLAQISQGYPGGPAAGEIHAQDERQKYTIQHALPGIRDKIRSGDTEGAVADMTKLGIPPGLQRYYLRQTISPQPSKRTMQNFQRTAPPEVMERYQRQITP